MHFSLISSLISSSSSFHSLYLFNCSFVKLVTPFNHEINLIQILIPYVLFCFNCNAWRSLSELHRPKLLTA
nr:MAG TPA: hypothetical protein [Caudoviricetes sp.]